MASRIEKFHFDHAKDGDDESVLASDLRTESGGTQMHGWKSFLQGLSIDLDVSDEIIEDAVKVFTTCGGFSYHTFERKSASEKRAFLMRLVQSEVQNPSTRLLVTRAHQYLQYGGSDIDEFKQEEETKKAEALAKTNAIVKNSAHVLARYNKNALSSHLNKSRLIPVELQDSLPNKDACEPEMWLKIDKVLDELHLFQSLTTKFIKLNNSSISKMKIVAHQAAYLMGRGKQMVVRAREGTEIFDYAAVEPDIKTLEQGFKDLCDFMDEQKKQFDTMSEKCSGVASRELMKDLQGLDKEKQNIAKRVEQEYRDLQKARRAKSKMDSKVVYLNKERDRNTFRMNGYKSKIESANARIRQLDQQSAQLEVDEASAMETAMKALVDQMEAESSRNASVLKNEQKETEKLENERAEAYANYQETLKTKDNMAQQQSHKFHHILMLQAGLPEPYRARQYACLLRMATSRGATVGGSQDKVSCICYGMVTNGESGFYTLEVDKTWEDVVNGYVDVDSSQASLGDYHVPWSLAKDKLITSMALQPDTVTVIHFFTTWDQATSRLMGGAVRKSDLAASSDIAAQIYQHCTSVQGSLCRSCIWQLKSSKEPLDSLAQSGNGGKDMFVDNNGKHHKFWQSIGKDKDVDGLFDAISTWTTSEVIRAQTNFQSASAKYETCAELVKQREEEIQAMSKRQCDQIKMNLDRIKENKKDKQEALQAASQHAKAGLNRISKDARESLAAYEFKLVQSETYAGSLEQDLQDCKTELQDIVKMVEKSQKAVDNTSATEVEAHDKCLKAFAKWDGPTVYRLLQMFNHHLSANELLMNQSLETFNEAAQPVAQMLNALNKKQAQSINAKVLPLKIMASYRDGRGLDMGAQAADFVENWKAIVKFHYPAAEDAQLEMFCDALQLADFCEVDGVESRNAHFEKLEEGLTEFLMKNQYLDKAEEEEDLKRAWKEAQEDDKVAKRVEAEGLKDTTVDKDEKKALKEAAKEAAQAMREAKKEYDSSSKRNLTEIKKENKVVFSMVRKLRDGVDAVHTGIQIENGAREFETNLVSLAAFFGTSVRSYCMDAIDVSEEYMRSISDVKPIGLQALEGICAKDAESLDCLRWEE